MKSDHTQWDERTLELAIDEVTCGLSPAELEQLLAQVDRSDLAALEHAAAAVCIAGIGKIEQPPAALLARLQSDARSHFARTDRPHASSRPASNWVAWSGWLAAALVLVAFLARGIFESTPSPSARRDQLVASATDLVRATWQATQDPLAGSVSGDVVWSSARQEGYMRFRDLPPNDPAKHQYQLWIFDAKRAEWEAKPVDGGVFDVGPGGEIVVPISAKLDVRDAKLFGVTLETPGGVVVSKREHLLATAAP